MLPWLLCAALAAIVLVLCVRLRLLQTALDEIAAQLGERLTGDTNTPIFLPTQNPHARKLAAELNVQLRELRRLRQRYEDGDRALKESVTNLSHDLRTPLTAICGYLELLERREKTPEMERYLALISDRVEAMKRLSEELFRCSVALSTQEDGLRLEPVDLNAAVEEAAASFYAALTARGIVPRVDICQERVVRPLDREALGRVLGNVLSNVLKYSSGDLEITLRPDGTLAFSNSAPGLDRVGTARLFDRFYTVENGRGSTGLGLSIARSLCQSMGGTAEAQYENGRLTILLLFPA